MRSPGSAALGLVVCAGLLFSPGRSVAQRLSDDPRSALAPPPGSVAEVAAGFAPTYVPAIEERAMQIPDEGEARATVEVEAGVCYAAIGFSDDVPDLDAWVRLDGRLIAQEVQGDAYPVARWCASRSGPVEIALSAYTTGGTAALGVYLDPESLERARGPADPLENRMLTALARTAPRWRPADHGWTETIAQVGTRAIEHVVEQPGCFGVIGVGDAGVRDLDLTLRDAGGQVVASDLALDDTPALLYCAAAAGAYSIEATVAHGGGRVAVWILLPPME